MGPAASRADAMNSGVLGSSGVTQRRPMLGGQRGDAGEPDLLARVVAVRHDQRHLHAGVEQHAQAAHADIVVSKHDRAGRRPRIGHGLRSRIALMT